jgi:Rho termination factor, N-terminal domain
MPNRTQAGYMPQYEKGMDIKRNTTRTAVARETLQDRKTEVSEIGRPDLIDAGDFGRPYEQWSIGDLENRARQLGLRVKPPATKDRLVQAIKSAESRPIESWTRTDLYYRARELGIPGRSSMTKRRLINALRKAEAHRV